MIGPCWSCWQREAFVTNKSQKVTKSDNNLSDIYGMFSSGFNTIERTHTHYYELTNGWLHTGTYLKKLPLPYAHSFVRCKVHCKIMHVWISGTSGQLLVFWSLNCERCKRGCHPNPAASPFSERVKYKMHDSSQVDFL